MIALIGAGCGVLSPEEQLLKRFFEAARLHDTTVMARLSDVTFNPRTEGVVQSFEILEGSADVATPTLTIEAIVRQPDGQIVPRLLAVTLRRQDRGWLITGITPLRASRTSRGASSAPPN